MKKDTKIIIAVVVVAFAVIGAMSMNSVQKKANYSGKSFNNAEVKNMKRGFMDKCATIPEMREICECTWNYLVDRKGYEGLLKMGLKMVKNENKIPPIMYDAMEYCIGK